MRKTMEEYGIDEVSPINDVEYICYKTIEDLKKIADTVGFTQDDAKILDIVHKNLRQARGEIEIKEPKSKKATVGELLKIVNKQDK